MGKRESERAKRRAEQEEEEEGERRKIDRYFFRFEFVCENVILSSLSAQEEMLRGAKKNSIFLLPDITCSGTVTRPHARVSATAENIAEMRAL
jgi:hypothetical protein